MGHFPTSLRNKMSEEEEIGWEGFWKWHERESIMRQLFAVKNNKKGKKGPREK